MTLSGIKSRKPFQSSFPNAFFNLVAFAHQYDVARNRIGQLHALKSIIPVSYTHLTLPTIEP